MFLPKRVDVFVGGEELIEVEDPHRQPARVIRFADINAFVQSLDVTEDQRVQLSRNDQGTPGWHKGRECRGTGARSGSMVHHNFFAKQIDLLREMLWAEGETKTNAAMRYGSAMERHAV